MKPVVRVPVLFSLAMVIGSLLCQQSGAAVVTYTNRAVWSNTVKDNALDTFSNLTGTTLASTINRPGYSVSASTVLDFPVALRTGNTQTVTTRPFLTALTSVATTFTLNLTAPRTAFGVDAFLTSPFGVRNLTSGNVSVTVNGVTLTQSTNGPRFFGFTSDTPFSQVTITKTAILPVLSIENVELATAVPEPSSIATTGLLAAAAVVVARRRRAAQKSAAEVAVQA